MTAPQVAPFVVRTPAQAQALLDFTYGARLLEKFMEPNTPSQAARALAEPANRVTYHVRKLMDAGLLHVAGRQGKRVLYQVTARTFHVPRAFVQLDGPLTLITPIMREITTAYAHAGLQWQLRRDHGPDGDGSHLTVHLDVGQQEGPQDEHEQDEKPAGAPEGPHAPAMRLRTLCLTPEQYRRAQAALDRVLTELAAEDDSPGARKSTFVVMGFCGGLHDS